MTGRGRGGRFRAARRALAAAAVLAVLAGCSADEPAAVDGQTREVTGADGETVAVPAGPERVVTLSEPTLDGALALGVTPVGTVSGRGQSGPPSYLAEQAADIPIVGAVAQPNLETIKGLDPDLILVDGTSVNNNPPLLETLGQIAPVVYTGFAGGDWEDNLRVTADALNLADAADDLVAGYEERVDDIAGRLGENADATVSVVRWQRAGPSLILKELLPGRVLTDLGLARPPAQDREGRGHSEPISLENLRDIDADWVFFGYLGGSSVGDAEADGGATAEAAQEALRTAAVETPGFMDLTAFREQHIVPVDGSVWTSAGGPILVGRVLDDIDAALTTE